MLSVDRLTVRHHGRDRSVLAVDDVSLEVGAGEIVGLVGESGCGKSSLARVVVGLDRPTSGTVRLDGTALHELRGRERRDHRRQAQLVFQDPYGSLDPHRSVGATIAEALAVAGVPRPQREARVVELLERVHLDPVVRRRRPRELSGGQCQRVAIARALAVGPRLLVCDEPVTALDVSVQARVLDLLVELRDELGTGCLFITHDLSVLARVADRIAVMHAGRIVETGPAEDVLTRPADPATVRLLEAVPRFHQHPQQP
ncbi:ABC transporter ATP-binding protein [Nocardioides sp. zg-ZUI104]|uniref:ABC transporter ATP-binding protein n=1 Tax=Nocardioides faecalis TaxID=2803858 RepID=UPI001BCED102|nr:ABC transporter ATP-binding protein [Nocardioides faecalis]MBS4754254.1 ABC transporter ATP-binding protein [Nocardioides faecalis]